MSHKIIETITYGEAFINVSQKNICVSQRKITFTGLLNSNVLMIMLVLTDSLIYVFLFFIQEECLLKNILKLLQL